MEFLGFIVTVLVFLAIIFVYVLYVTRGKEIPKSQRKFVDLDVIHEKWQGVNLMMKEGGPVNYRQAIIEADKIVDAVLRSRVDGATMGERLKLSRNLFTQHAYDQLWMAHKIRNKVAHEADFEGLSSDARLAIRNYEKALKELRAI
ncbi:MAG: hypothetical protein PHT36_01945 [Patescibacteria group bacterium]|nr:hypothetical protein [Patescibacteria group bacterium]